MTSLRPWISRAVGAFALSTLVTGANATPVQMFIGGNLQFNQVQFQEDLPQSVIDSIISFIPTGAFLQGQFTVETTTPDADPDPNTGDYIDAVTSSTLSINGFQFLTSPTGFCNPSFDCKVMVRNDTFSIPTGEAFDQLTVASQNTISQSLTDAVTAATGVSPPPIVTSGGVFPVEAPFVGNLRLFAFDFDLVGDDSLFDPLAAPYNSAAFTIFISGAWKELGTATARIDYELTNIQVSPEPVLAPVPLPAALPLLFGAFGALGVMGWRRRKVAAAQLDRS